ncbi:maleylpyruvate isomerase family mycothiol-dependent enzyme [Nocardia terpenica]|uniref:Maleylpyruvate isomerase family mycothiol-dependent enzyme n=1 Tax=Nocardia terpenica TaxID=455432 RepID=A0A291RFN2_9NOCA|nr:maleylpyruvate isomerase family mycothiol-dependent enzyme [Nocardia terpenica]ATL65944.1 hypothetical protein CRH09_06655 [Nocardia terpenica]
MTTPTFDRAELAAGLSEQWNALARLTTGLTERRWRTPSPLPGWTAFDVLAHVIGIESILLGEPTPTVEAEVTAFGHVRNQVGELNETWVESLRPLTGERLRERFVEVAERRRKALAAMSEADWQQPTPSPVGVVPYGRFMRTRLFDCWMHELDIADALGVPVDEGGVRAELALDEIVPYLGRTLVKRGGAPAGSRITVELTGPVTRTLHVRVEERAELVAALDRPADVVIRLGSGLFARLCGGRVRAADHADAIELSCDTELGRRLADHLGFTI